MPGLESFCSNLVNIAPNYSGHLDYMNENNSLLIDTKIRYAKNMEQYWTFNPKSKISECDFKHTVELMRKAYHEYDSLLLRFKPGMKKTTSLFSWDNAAKKIISSINGEYPHYIPGTYKIPR